MKKLELREVAGGGLLFAPERNLRYGEIFAGIERVFKWPFMPLPNLSWDFMWWVPLRINSIILFSLKSVLRRGTG